MRRSRAAQPFAVDTEGHSAPSVGTFPGLNSIAQSNSESTGTIGNSVRLFAAAPSVRRAAHPVSHQTREFIGDPSHLKVFLTVPTLCGVAHTENGERNKPRIQIGAKFALRDAVLNDPFENAFEAARPASDAAPGFGR